jgi:hypothetical protein
MLAVRCCAEQCGEGGSLTTLQQKGRRRKDTGGGSRLAHNIGVSNDDGRSERHIGHRPAPSHSCKETNLFALGDVCGGGALG